MPEGCLTAVGKKVTVLQNLKPITVNEVVLPFRIYRVTDSQQAFYVFYCLWQDRSSSQAFDREDIVSWRSRLMNVVQGRRNLGQRSLEIAVWGHNDARDAEAAVVGRLPKLIQVK
jgi:hypothetical protein